MFYKKFMYTLLIAGVYSFLISCQTGTDSQQAATQSKALADQDSAQSQPTPGIPQDVLDFLNGKFKDVNPQSGEFIKESEAKVKYKEFKTFRGRSPEFNREPHGFAFGLEKVKTFMEAIEIENGKMDVADTNYITGVRAQLVKSMTDKGKPYLDVLLVPVKKSGNTYIDLTAKIAADSIKQGSMAMFMFFAEGDLLLNTSVPCPDMCPD